ncbi:anthranilate synthase component 1 [Elasticomyces elasticus]|nr:anthranilate synthase component 1 [Elasticomyces elasticus]
MDTCIALRTMLVKDGVAYLQAGGGIVFDSDPYEEYIETMNKLRANMHCVESAEEKHLTEQEGGEDDEVVETEVVPSQETRNGEKADGEVKVEIGAG